jgi:hypothetical protein
VLKMVKIFQLMIIKYVLDEPTAHSALLHVWWSTDGVDGVMCIQPRSSTSVISSLLASGYTLGVGALDSARELDGMQQPPSATNSVDGVAYFMLDW